MILGPWSQDAPKVSCIYNEKSKQRFSSLRKFNGKKKNFFWSCRCKIEERHDFCRLSCNFANCRKVNLKNSGSDGIRDTNWAMLQTELQSHTL